MIRTLILDGDGVSILRDMRFSDRLLVDFGIKPEVTRPFFVEKYPACRVGKADLKIELNPYYKAWGWKGTLDELLSYWFTKEGRKNEELLKTVALLREKGVKVFMSTDNEKYRTEYIVHEFGMGEHFDGVLASAYIGHSKEEPGFWQHVKELGVPPAETLVWDDETENLEAARGAGFTAELYTGMDAFNATMKRYFPLL